MASPIQLAPFTGMNNTVDRTVVGKRIAPKIILNACVNQNGQLISKPDSSSALALTNGQNWWAGDKWSMIIDDDNLYAWDGITKTDLGETADTDLSFVEIDQTVYISGVSSTSKKFNGETLSDWGITPPTLSPVVTVTEGTLPHGVYSLCFTYAGSPISGNSPITQIEIAGGLNIVNRPDGALLWITPPNSKVLLYAGAVDSVTAIPANVQSLPSLDCTVPPPMKHLTAFAGRVWGTNGRRLYYTEPVLEWWKRNNVVQFDEAIVQVAKIDGVGLFVSSLQNTWFLSGNDPAQMTMRRVGNGAIEGMLVYRGVRYQGQAQILPVWMGPESSPCVGTSEGVILPKKGKLKMNLPSRGTAGKLNLEGEEFLVFSADISSASGNDAETLAAFNNNYI